MDSSDKSFFKSKKVIVALTAIVSDIIAIVLWYFGVSENLSIALISGISGLSAIYIAAQSTVDKKSTETQVLKTKMQIDAMNKN